jgi:hypothetical protein
MGLSTAQEPCALRPAAPSVATLKTLVVGKCRFRPGASDAVGLDPHEPTARFGAMAMTLGASRLPQGSFGLESLRSAAL